MTSLPAHLEVLSRRDIAPEDWSAAADTFPAAWLWHRPEAIDAYARWDDSEDCSFGILDHASGGRIVAILPLHRTMTKKIVARLESTGGLATSPDLTAGQLRNVEAVVRHRLRRQAAEIGAYRIDLSAPPLAPAYIEPTIPAINPHVMLGCHDNSTLSWVVDLRDTTEAGLWQRLDHRVRKSVKRARNLGISVRRATMDDLPSYLALHVENCRRNGIPRKPSAYFEAIFSTFASLDEAMILSARSNTGAPLAFHVFAVYKAAALYWTVASDAQALSSGANDLVQWEAMCRFLDSGIRFYETGEAFPALERGKLKRISDFKKGFGGDLRTYFRGEIVTRPIIGASIALARAICNTYRAPFDES